MTADTDTEPNNSCIFTIPWRGECGTTETVTTDPELCQEHSEKTCWCGKPAVKACSKTGGLVCGQPLCEDHHCHRDYRTGDPHSEKGREQYESYQEQTNA